MNNKTSKTHVLTKFRIQLNWTFKNQSNEKKTCKREIFKISELTLLGLELLITGLSALGDSVCLSSLWWVINWNLWSILANVIFLHKQLRETNEINNIWLLIFMIFSEHTIKATEPLTVFIFMLLYSIFQLYQLHDARETLKMYNYWSFVRKIKLKIRHWCLKKTKIKCRITHFVLYEMLRLSV